MFVGANVWTNVEGVILNKHILKKLKRKLLLYLHLHGRETGTLTEQQQQTLPVRGQLDGEENKTEDGREKNNE